VTMEIQQTELDVMLIVQARYLTILVLEEILLLLLSVMNFVGMESCFQFSHVTTET